MSVSAGLVVAVREGVGGRIDSAVVPAGSRRGRAAEEEKLEQLDRVGDIVSPVVIGLSLIHI